MFDYKTADVKALVSHADSAMRDAAAHKADAAQSRANMNSATAIAGRAGLAAYSRSNMTRKALNASFKERLGDTVWNSLKSVFSMAGTVAEYFSNTGSEVIVTIGKGDNQEKFTVNLESLLDDDCAVTVAQTYKAIRERQKTRAVEETEGDAASREAIGAYIRANPEKCAGLCVDDIWASTAKNLHERARIVDLGNEVLKQEQLAQLAERENVDRERARVDAINTLSHADMITALRKAGYVVSKKKETA